MTFRAFDVNEQRWVFAWEADPSHTFIDPFTNEEVYLRVGHVREVFGKRVFVRSHFVHSPSEVRRIYTRDFEGKP